jgi:hypothetical protein
MLILLKDLLKLKVTYGEQDHWFKYCFYRYRNGVRGHMKTVIQDLLRQYLKVEIQFQNGQFFICWWEGI